MDRKTFVEIKSYIHVRIQRRKFALHLLKDALLLGWIGVASYWLGGGMGALMSIPAISILMFRNFSLMHDAVHGAVIRPRWLNDCVGTLCGAVALLPYEPWKMVHLKHHVWSGNVDKDPVMLIIKAFPKWPYWLQNTLNFFWRSWIPLIACLQHGVFWLQSVRQTAKEPTPKMLASTVAPGLFWGYLLNTIPSTFLLTTLAPAVVLYLILVECVNLPHHLDLPQYHGEAKLPVWEQYKIARSCVYPRWFAENVVLNFNFHIEHHMYPGAPWYYLDQVRDSIEPILAKKYHSDPQFAWILSHRPKNLSEVLRAMEAAEDHHFEEQRTRLNEAA